MQNTNTWEKYSEVQLKDCEKFCKGYMDFLSTCKTERECVSKIVSDIEEAGYLPLDEKIKKHVKLKAGDKVYAVNMDKAVVMFNIGEESIENGLNILGAHIDSPRMDIKQNPLYEEGGFAYLDTHYYAESRSINGLPCLWHFTELLLRRTETGLISQLERALMILYSSCRIF